MLSIQTNVNSMNAQENLRVTNDFQARTIARLTSGFRINQSGDDAAGLAVANKFRSDIAELAQGVRNANDGLSTLQIIDGGLGNISRMLDRLKTLATQSASSTFEGDRATLDREFQALKTEIDRQASNIGLGSDGGSASRYHKNLKVYTGGGGDYTGNSAVEVDLGEDGDVVTSTQLGLSGQTILGGDGTNIGTFQTGDVTTSSTFTFNIEGEASAVTATITGVASGYTATEALQDLNDQIGSYGLRASVVDGDLKIFSDKAFTVALDAVAATDIVTANSGSLFNVNADLNRWQIEAGNLDDMGSGVTATNADAFVITFDDGTVRTVTSSSGTRWNALANAVTDLNAALKENGVTVLANSTNDGLIFMSKKSDFTVTFDNDAAAAGGALTASGAGEGYTAAQVSDNTETAKAALAAVNDAVSKLGIVQGKVGTAQNKLTYAIQLAQSQIVNFSAAESRIRDADIASEAANLTKAQVLSQASMAALAQANTAPQSVLSLLRG